MRESPSCVVELRRFGVWRMAVGIVAAAAIASMAAWAGLPLADQSSNAPWIAMVAALLAVMSALIAASLARVEPGTLACIDGSWTFTCRRRGVDRVESGALTVAVDLGSFLLLTLTHADSSRRVARRWLPVQRRGLEADWHALRYAVYSPPPAIPAAASTSEPLPE